MLVCVILRGQVYFWLVCLTVAPWNGSSWMLYKYDFTSETDALNFRAEALLFCVFTHIEQRFVYWDSCFSFTDGNLYRRFAFVPTRTSPCR